MLDLMLQGFDLAATLVQVVLLGFKELAERSALAIGVDLWTESAVSKETLLVVRDVDQRT